VRPQLVTLARMVCASVSYHTDGPRADAGALRWRHQRIGVRLSLLAVFFSAAQSLGSGLFELRKLRLCGGGPAALTKLDMAAAEGPDVVVPPVLADSSGDDNSDHMDTSRDGAAQALPASLHRTPSAPAGKAGSSGPRAWTAEEIRAVQEAVHPAFCHDPHLQIRPLTADGGISKHVVQAGGRGPVTPKDGETVFFHYELYYEDALVASSRVRNGRFQPALSQRLKSRRAGEREQDGGAQAHEANEAASLSSWEVILRNMSRGERALFFVTTERRQQQLVLAPFMTVAANISAHLLRTASSNTNATSGGAGCPANRDKGMLARKPLRVLVEVLAFGRELLQPPVPWPAAAYLGAVPTLRLQTEAEAEAEAEAESLCGALRGGRGQVVYECRGWGSGDASPDFGDEVLLRWRVVRGKRKRKWGGRGEVGAARLAARLANCRSLLLRVQGLGFRF